MNKIEKEIRKEIVEYETIYKATDGTEFTSEEECTKYEKSALGVMRSRVTELIVFDSRGTREDAWTILGGLDDHNIVAIKMKNKDDFNTVCQFFLLECPWYNSEDRKEQRDSIIFTIKKAFNQKDIVLFGINYDGDVYFINSRQNIINKLNTLDKAPIDDIIDKI